MTTKLIYKKADYELTARMTKHNGVFCLKIFTVWPRARTDTSPHEQISLNLNQEAMCMLGGFILGQTVIDENDEKQNDN